MHKSYPMDRELNPTYHNSVLLPKQSMECNGKHTFLCFKNGIIFQTCRLGLLDAKARKKCPKKIIKLNYHILSPTKFPKKKQLCLPVSYSSQHVLRTSHLSIPTLWVPVQSPTLKGSSKIRYPKTHCYC